MHARACALKEMECRNNAAPIISSSLALLQSSFFTHVFINAVKV